MTSKTRQSKSQEGIDLQPQKQLEAPAVIEAVKHSRYKVARLYGRVTIARQEYFYVRAQDILVRSDIFHAYRREGFQRFLQANAGDAVATNVSSGLSPDAGQNHERG